MSLLNQLGLEPIGRTKKKNLEDVIVVYNPSTKYNAVTLLGLMRRENLNWGGMDAAYSKAHGGVVIAKGDTFDVRKDQRVSSTDFCRVIVTSFGIDVSKGNGVRIYLNASRYSEDVYVLKLAGFEYIK